METALSLKEFVKSDVTFSARFESRLITLDDTEAFIRFLKAVMEAAQTEIQERIEGQFEILPIVSVTKGSIRFRIEVKPNSWNAEIRVKVHEVFLAIALMLNPNATAELVGVHVPQLSPPCAEAVQAAHHEALEAWKYFGKGFQAEFESSCGSTTTRSKISVPAVE